MKTLNLLLRKSWNNFLSHVQSIQKTYIFPSLLFLVVYLLAAISCISNPHYLLVTSYNNSSSCHVFWIHIIYWLQQSYHVMYFEFTTLSTSHNNLFYIMYFEYTNEFACMYYVFWILIKYTNNLNFIILMLV